MSYLPRKVYRKIDHFREDLWRTIARKPLDLTIVNQKELRVVGLKRTGNHAVLKWIKSQQSGVIEHLNNVRPNENPFRDKYEHLQDNYPEHQGVIDRLRSQARGELVPKDCLICSYEDWELSKIATKNFEAKHDLYVGKSAERYDLLILRDPFNLIASRLKHSKMQIQLGRQTIVDLWVDYAREFLGETQYLQHRKVCINYNRWFQDVEYRRYLADLLKLDFTDAGIDKMTYHGGGSSFEGRELDGQATQLKVLDRWQSFKDDSVYQKLIADDRIWYYFETIFGCLPN